MHYYLRSTLLVHPTDGSLAKREFTNKTKQEASLLLVKKKGLLVLPTVSNAIPFFAYFSPNISSTSFACATTFLRATLALRDRDRDRDASHGHGHGHVVAKHSAQLIEKYATLVSLL